MRYQDEVRYETLPVLVKRMSAQAVLINLGEGGDHWIPQSCFSVQSLSEICEGFLGDVEIAQWVLQRKGLL